MPARDRTIDVRYPDDYHNKDLAGKTSRSSTSTFMNVEEKHLPELDEEFCREYGVLEGGIEQLRSEVADNMRRELTENVRCTRQAAAARPAARGKPGRCAARVSSRRRSASSSSRRRGALAPRKRRSCRRPSSSSNRRGDASRSAC